MHLASLVGLVAVLFAQSSIAEDYENPDVTTVCFPVDSSQKEQMSSDGGRFDLSPLYRESNQPDWIANDKEEGNEYTYYVNMCGQVHNSVNGTKTHAGVYQEHKQTKVGKNAGRASSTKINIIEDNILRVVISDGDHCHRAQALRQSIFTLICSPDKPDDHPPYFVAEDTDTCMYTFEWETKFACPSTVKVSHSKKKKGVSGGVIFLIIFLSSLLVYLVGGFLFNRLYLGKTGYYQLPHFDFWRNLVDIIINKTQALFQAIFRRGQTAPVHYSGIGSDTQNLIDDDDDDDDENLLAA